MISHRLIAPVIAAIVLSGPAVASSPLCDLAHLPPPSAWQVPTVPMEVHVVPSDKINAWCHKLKNAWILNACTYAPDVTPNHKAVILLSDALTEEERVCVLLYEEAHLPGNNWYDPAVEASIPNDPKTTRATDNIFAGMRTGRGNLITSQ